MLPYVVRSSQLIEMSYHQARFINTRPGIRHPAILRSLPIRRDEVNAENGTVGIPAPWVKKRRVINQPLSDPANGARPSSSQMPGSMTRGLK